MTMLEKLRRKRNMTRQDLSDKSGVSLRTIEAYEQGSKDLSKSQVNILNFLADALGTRIPALVGFADDLAGEALKFFEELCLATDEELIKRNDETGDLFKDDRFIISCITGTQWFGDYGTPLKDRRMSPYVFYFIARIDESDMPGNMQLFAGTKLH